MRFLWAQDFDFMTHPGGAQLTDRAHFLEGIHRGHDIKIWSPESELDDSEVKEGVIVIASNPAFLPVDAFQLMLDRDVPYLWLFHDYLPVCKYRLFYPKRESCKACYLKERWLPILLRSKMLIWLSPLHRNSWLWLCPELESIPHHLAPSPVDFELFYNVGVPRQGVITVESLHSFKGRDQVLKWAREHPEVQVTCVGGNPSPGESLPPNCKELGGVRSFKMNELYNQHETFLHLPQNPSPFDRTVPEAYLAGCEVIGNELIGALSYEWFNSRENVAEHCKKSPREFWERIEEVVGC